MIEEYDELDEVDEHCLVHRCPMGLAQLPCDCLGYREREPCRLQLRVLMGTDEGVCDAIAEEYEDRVYVRVVLCYDDSEDRGTREYLNCPAHVYLEQPLGDRIVIDAQTGHVLPLFVPSWG